ncbi:hypothetical protein IW15_15995 [Chryseobacterium soli]|uniref:Uncharacterized protein n=1 Tax=Chryseobacterium soli TaxID=445961 RepID=A0A086A3J3_9FLAO|nr:hypothetical protein [Chryseobacterium soli]KFF11257.1 hypothetical protein IW15_15995 [Chryseobacterium soli]
MKKIIIVSSILLYKIFFAQVIIGDAIGTATDKTSVLLEFANTNNKGIILPYVKSLPAGVTPGTILLDASNPSQARIKYYNGIWQDLSGRDGNINTALAQQTNNSENANAKVIIGSNTSSADGVLVLESTTQAMVIPVVNDVNNIPSPSPGMMVYVNKTGAKRLAFFNGSIWSFWASN